MYRKINNISKVESNTFLGNNSLCTSLREKTMYTTLVYDCARDAQRQISFGENEFAKHICARMLLISRQEENVCAGLFGSWHEQLDIHFVGEFGSKARIQPRTLPPLLRYYYTSSRISSHHLCFARASGAPQTISRNLRGLVCCRKPPYIYTHIQSHIFARFFFLRGLPLFTCKIFSRFFTFLLFFSFIYLAWTPHACKCHGLANTDHAPPDNPHYHSCERNFYLYYNSWENFLLKAIFLKILGKRKQ